MTEKRFYLDENGINDREYEFSVLGEDELVDIINELNDENQQCENEIARLQLINNKLKDKNYTNYKEKIQELLEENNELKYKNELLSDELEQCKAVINKKWDEYLKKKELSEWQRINDFL